jgi:hypothetical protein
VLHELVTTFFLKNFIAPNPMILQTQNILPNLTFTHDWNFSVLGGLTIVYWIALLIGGIYLIIRKKENIPFFMGITICLLFNFCLHSFYGIGSEGIELFLYTGNFTFLVLTALSNYSLSGKLSLKLALCALVVLFSINNISIMYKSASIFKSASDGANKIIQTDNNQIQNSESDQTENSILNDYRSELNNLRYLSENIFELPNEKYFLFGMGSRRKMLYKDGSLLDSLTGEIIKKWQIAKELIIPPSYEVDLTTTDGKRVLIYEDEQGVWLKENDKVTLLSGGRVNLPNFNGNPNALVLRVLLQEVLINIVDEKPLPNYFVYSKPWYRDAALMCMVLNQTGNLELVRDWILNLDQPFDLNNSGEQEPDNLGEVLYMISLVSDQTHPLVNEILATIPQFIEDNHIDGVTDYANHPVYQTAWVKLGLDSLKLPDPYQLPDVSDSYANLIWWLSSPHQIVNGSQHNSFQYPYLTWASNHMNQTYLGVFGDLDYPLSWESQASGANYSGIQIVSQAYANQAIGAPHGWAASELFFYLFDPNTKSK